MFLRLWNKRHLKLQVKLNKNKKKKKEKGKTITIKIKYSIHPYNQAKSQLNKIKPTTTRTTTTKKLLSQSVSQLIQKEYTQTKTIWKNKFLHPVNPT